MPLKDDLRKLTRLTEKKSREQLAAYEKEIISQYKEALKSMRAELSKFYESNYSTQRLIGVTNKIEKILQDAGVSGLKTTQKGVKESVNFNFNAVQENLRSVIGAELSFAVLPTETVNSLVVNNKFAKIDWQKHGLKNIQQDSQLVKNKVYQSVIRGENYDVVSKQISSQVNMTASNALRIVKTEVHRASNEARILSMEKSRDAAEKLGFKSVKIWEGGESFPRAHDSMNGTSIPVNDDFELPSGASTSAPGLSGNPGDDINCGCYLEFDIEEIPMTEPLPESKAFTEPSINLKDQLTAKLFNAVSTTKQPGLMGTTFTEAELSAPARKSQELLFRKQMEVDHAIKIKINNLKQFTLNELKRINTELDEAFREMKQVSPLVNNRLNKRIASFEIQSVNSLGETKVSSGAVGSYNPMYRRIKFAGKSEFSSAKGELEFGGWVVDKSMKGVFKHEFGHHVDYTLNYGPSTRILKDKAGLTFVNMMKKYKFYDRELGIHGEVISKNVSQYATTNLQEVFAESFNAITHPNYWKYGKRLPEQIENWFVETLKIKKP